MSKPGHPHEPHLVAFGQKMLNDMGMRAGGAYLLRCFALWEQVYGQDVAGAVRAKLRQHVKEKKHARGQSRL